MLEIRIRHVQAPKSPLPLNLRPLAGGYFFLLADFLAAGFVTLDFCGFALADLLAIILLLFWSLTPLRHVSFPAEEPSMADGAAAVNHTGEVSGAEFCQDCFDAREDRNRSPTWNPDRREHQTHVVTAQGDD